MERPRSRFTCLLAAYEYWQTYSAESHRVACDCLKASAPMEPQSALVYANLAFIELEGYRTGFSATSGLSQLDEATAAAQQAIRLKPQSSRAQQALMATLFARGSSEAGMEAGEKALRANPYDSDIAAYVGVRRIATGDIDAGMT